VIHAEIGWGEVALTALVVVLGYVALGLGVPDALRRYRRDEVPATLVWLARAILMLTRPAAALGERLAAALGRVLPEPAEKPSSAVGFEEELVPLIATEGDGDVIETAEQAMIQGVLDLEELTVREIMVPRVDIVAVPVDVPATELIDRIVRAGHSRIPVYRESIDDIIGFLYAKDLLPFVVEEPADLPIEQLLRPRYVVPESKRVDDLLRELRRAHVHVAIVADEYGGTAGLVTIEDILEEIVGEIQDEYDRELPLIERIDERSAVLDARLPIDEVAEALLVRFPEDGDYETLGGYVQTVLGRLPREGDHFTDPSVGLDATVLAVEGRRIRRVQLVRVDGGDATAALLDEPVIVAPTIDVEEIERGGESTAERGDDGPAVAPASAERAGLSEER
jgi:CBS domain containing-hemolysin-like protein